MEPLDALAQSTKEAESRLALLNDDHWELPTPCSEWNVQQLVNHLLLGTRMSVQLLAGGSQKDVIAQLGEDMFAASADPIAEFSTLAAEMQEGFARPGGLDGTVDHPMGEIPRTMFIGFRVMDNGAHAWDLARAIGADEQLDADLVASMWESTAPSADTLGSLGIFGEAASGTLGEDAPLQQRFLDLVGRRP